MSNASQEYFARFFTEDSRGNFVDFEIGNAHTEDNGVIYVYHSAGVIVLIPEELNAAMESMRIKNTSEFASVHSEIGKVKKLGCDQEVSA